MENSQNHKTYRGKVFSSPEIDQIPVRQNLSVYQKKTGICFFPKTLNVRLDTDFEIPKGGIHINKDELKTTEHRTGITLVPATFRSDRIFLICPDHPTHKPKVIEIVASFNMWRKFNITDDDYIEFEVESEQKSEKIAMKNLNWIKYKDGEWCNLITLNLKHEHFIDLEGVYIIWHGGDEPEILSVGQGNIKEKLFAYRIYPRIMKYKKFGLYVTWAIVEPQYRNGIEKYLFEKLKPKEGFRYPDVPAIQVNMPWD